MVENLNHITTTNNGGATTVCVHCGVYDGLLLHSVSHHGSILRLCSTCVLRLHRDSFCPTCFTTVYHHNPSPPPNSADITCSNCYSVSHASCVGPVPQYPYVCPLCIKPANAPFFELKKLNEMNVNGSGGFGDDMVMSLNGFGIDDNAARVLLAAAMISSNSMSKAALAAKSEAERRALEAVNTRKRAKHALEHMSLVAANEKMKMRKGTISEGNVRGSTDSYSRHCVGNGGGGVLDGARFSEKDPVVRNGERL